MKPSKKIKKWIFFVVMATGCALGAVQLYAMKPKQTTGTKNEIPLKQVSYVTAAVGTYPARVNTFGEVAAKWTTTLKADVGGRIIHINEKLQPGHHLEKGEILLRIDNINYRTALAQARLELENARVNLIQTERRAAQAKADWQGSGIGQAPSSPLVFHTPQLRAARTRVDYAEKSVAKAKNDLAHTTITAPYTGRVTQRFADKGEILFAGDPVATLISADNVEVRVNLDQAQISILGKWQQAKVTLRDPATSRSWQGKLTRAGGEINPKNRQCKFFITPRDPENTLIPGMFLTAQIAGNPQSPLLALPESALTREGDIWIIDNEDRLRRRSARPAFYDSGQVFVETAATESTLRVAAMPAPGFISGTPIAPQPIKTIERQAVSVEGRI